MSARKPLRYVVGHTDRISHRKLTTFEERNDGHRYYGARHFDTWADAHAFVVARAADELRDARRALKNAERRVARAAAMKGQTP